MNNKWFTSSTGSGDLALTLKGMIMSVFPLVLMVAQMSGHSVPFDETNIDEFITAVTSFIAAVMFFVGLVRKIASYISKVSTE